MNNEAADTHSSGLPDKIRAFIAIYPSAEILRSIEGFQAEAHRIFSKESARWTRPEQLHLTLQFLGYIESARLPAFEFAVREATKNLSSFEVTAKNLGAFPSNHRPRIFWVGLDGAALENLKLRLDEALQPLGFVPEKRRFHSHITLARLNEISPQEIQRLKAEMTKNPNFGSWKVTHVDLMRSILRPTGATYSLLKSFPFEK